MAVTGWIKILVYFNFSLGWFLNQRWFFQPRSNFFKLGYYELSNKGFPYSWGNIMRKMGPGFLGGIKKKIIKKNTLINLSLAFRPFSIYRLSLFFPSSLLSLPKNQRTVPLTLSFYNIPCRSKDANPRAIGRPRLLLLYIIIITFSSIFGWKTCSVLMLGICKTYYKK